MHLLLPRIFSLLHVCVQARVTRDEFNRPKALAFASLKAKQTKELIPTCTACAAIVAQQW